MIPPKHTLLFFCFLLAGYALPAQGALPPIDSVSAALLKNLPLPSTYQQAVALAEKYPNPQSLDTFIAYQKQALAYARMEGNENNIVATYDILHNNPGPSASMQDMAILAERLFAELTVDSLRLYMAISTADRAVRNGDFDTGRRFLDSTIAILETTHVNKLEVRYHFLEGVYHTEVTKDLIEAVNQFNAARQLTPDNKDLTVGVNYNLAMVYTRIGFYEGALAISEENLKITQQQDNTVYTLFTYYGLADIYGKLKRYDDMLATCRAAVSLSDSTGIRYSFGYIYTKFSEYYRLNDQLDLAMHYAQKSIDLSTQQGETLLLYEAYVEMAKSLYENGDFERAIHYGEQALEYGATPEVGAEAILSKAYRKLGRTEKAYEMLDVHRQELQRINDEQSSNSLLLKLLEDKTAQEEEALKRNAAVQARQQRNIFLFSLLGVIILLGSILVSILLRSRRRLSKANASLQESNEALRQFAYITSHDLKEPVRNITSFSGLLARDLASGDIDQQKRDYLSYITNSAGVLREIVGSLQVFIQASFGELKREKIEIDALFQQVKEQIQTSVAERNARVTFNTTTRATQLHHSKAMLTLVLQNLILNGIKYNEQDQPVVNVSVESLANSNKLLFKVSDNGIGIDPEYQEDIFSPFKTLANKSLTQSSGLGLSICKTIVERYGGTIWVQSDGRSSSTFTFTA